LLDKDNVPSSQVRFLLQEHDDTLEFFNKKIAAVTEKMRTDVADDPVVKQLLQQSGIGVITAITLRAMIGQFDRFRTGNQLAHFCAVCLRNHSSAGKTTTGGLIKAGDELLRQVLVEAAHRLIRYDSEWKAMADRLRDNGKKTCVIVAAVANRWIRKLFRQRAAVPPMDETSVGFLRPRQKSPFVIKCPPDVERSSSDGIRKTGI
jgi:transposase